MAQPNYNIWIRTVNIVAGVPVGLKRLALIRNYDNLEMKTRYNNVGGWTLRMEDGTTEANLLRQLLIGSSTDPANTTSSGRGYGGITVVRDGQIIFSGPVRGFVATGDYTGQDGPVIEFHGTDDSGYLADRVSMARAPTSIGPPLAGQFIAPSNQGWGYWVYPEPPSGGDSGFAATVVLRNMVYNNLGPGAPFNLTPAVQNRQIPFLDVPNVSGAGAKTRVRARYQNLLTKCQEVATYVELDPDNPDYIPGYRGAQFQINQTDDDLLRFNCALPSDKSNRVIFSAGFGNLGAYRYSLESPQVNFSIIAGQGDEADRWFAHRGAQANAFGPSILKYGLREGFLDRRDIEYPIPDAPPPYGTVAPVIGNASYTAMVGEFVRAMDGQLREEGEIIELEVDAIDVSPTKYFTDYNVGDLVTVVIENQDIVGQVMDVTISLTKAEGEVIKPTIGTQVIGSTFRLFNQISNIRKNVGTLESGK